MGPDPAERISKRIDPHTAANRITVQAAFGTVSLVVAAKLDGDIGKFRANR
jgi:hypothetical protein